MTMADSAKAKETAKKKVTRNANPEETLVRGPESSVEGDKALASKSLGGSADEALVCGYSTLEADLDPFDNERNYNRVTEDAPGFGPKKKSFEKEED